MFISLVESTNFVSITRKTEIAETKLFNDIMTHDNKNAIKSYKKFMKKFSKFWKDEKFIDIQWMKFSFRENWQVSVSEKFKVYSLSLENRKVVNKTFDELHRQEWLI